MEGQLAIILALAALVVVNMAVLLWVVQGRGGVSSQSATPHLEPGKAAELQKTIDEGFRQIVEQNLSGLSTQLGQTTQKLNEQVLRLTTEVIEHDLTKYQELIESTRASAARSLSQIQSALEEQSKVLQGKMVAEVAAEKQRLLQKFTDKVADIMGAYLADSLGAGVDLGAQSGYIMAMLEAHKEELKRDIARDL